MPWVTMNIQPSGTTTPCCLTEPGFSIGNTQTQSLQEIWNSEKMRELRRTLLSDQRPDVCKACYVYDSIGMRSLRQKSMTYYDKHFSKVSETTSTGDAGPVNMAFMDLRFSNLCNLKCRTCGPGCSSSWHSDHTEIFGAPSHPADLQVRNNMISFWQELEPILPTVEEVFFAGGEPLINENHYKMLDRWIELGKTDVEIVYVTNFTNMSFKGCSIYDYWKQFKNVTVMASLDGSYQRGEYLRKNLKWDRIVQNRREMIEQCPDVKFHITPTVSVYNVFHLPDFYSEWVELGLVAAQDVSINFLTEPPFMSLQILPEPLKKQVREKYKKLLSQLESGDPRRSRQAIQNFSAVLHHLDQADKSTLVPQWREYTQKVDRYRQENVFDVFPELRPMENNGD